MNADNKVAAAILAAALLPKATAEQQTLEEAAATMARLYHQCLTLVGQPEPRHKTDKDWRDYAGQIFAVLPH
jgi:hypothetical protein